MDNFTPFSALLGGAIIGCSVILLLLYNGRMAGISGIMNRLLSLESKEVGWRLAFLAGLVLGGMIFHLLHTNNVDLRQNYPLGLIAVGGFLVGVGTRLGSGCTSGHGICGLANLSKRSLFATLTFMVTGMITVYLIKHVLGLY